MSLQWTLQHDSKSVLTKISFSVNICCLQNMNYSFPGVSFEPDFHLAWKDAQLSLPAFQGFIWFTSMTLVDFSFCMSSGRNSPLFSYRWLRYMKLWTSHYTFVEFLFLIAEAIFFLVKKKKKKLLSGSWKYATNSCHDWPTHSAARYKAKWKITEN